MLSDNRHSAACKQSYSRIKIQMLAVLILNIYSVLGVITAVVSECVRYCSESVNEWLSDSSECWDTSELLFKHALENRAEKVVWTDRQDI